jgi:hypothetical protein
LWSSEPFDHPQQHHAFRNRIYAPSGRQGIASAGYISTRKAPILAPS